jgi:NDP-sugar pyrophosphorylase family protein
MKAMILAAGLGTRLRPLTDDRPKALVEVAGHSLLEIALRRLRIFGVNDVIINTHHHAGMIAEYLQANSNFNMHLTISHEDQLLDTGGGLKQAAWFFLERGGESHEPFILHNVDVISTIDLGRMMQLHNEKNALATLAVQQRDTSRHLLFDEHGELCGRQAGRTAERELVRAVRDAAPLAFSGIHIISPRLLAMMEEKGAFSIITAYLRLAAQGERITAFHADEYYWRDLGRPESLSYAAQDLHSGLFSIA